MLYKKKIINNYFYGNKMKRQYAKEHNINLLEIWYYDFENIEIILDEKLKFESVETAG